MLGVEEEMSQHAIENAQAWFEEIVKHVTDLQSDDEHDSDMARERIQEGPLSVQVRSGWHNPGEVGEAAEFEILLTTGGPALRVHGDLDQYGQPASAFLEWQDWGTPWTGVHMSELLLHQPSDMTASKADEILLTYAGVFYFGE